GPNSSQAEAQIDSLLTMLNQLFLRKLSGQLKNTLFMMVADHGQVEALPETTIYLNQEPQFTGIERFLARNQRGDYLIPGGSCRDMFLYIKPDLLDEAHTFLTTHLAGRAEVYAVQTLIEQGFFGPQPLSPTLLSRLGNLVIFPYQNESVWWYEKGRFEQNHRGHHGGLTPPEMEIPLMLYDLSP
ncbi:MAG: alkaline phosphatase family protein, partial [Chloroflexota bacterium]